MCGQDPFRPEGRGEACADLKKKKKTFNEIVVIFIQTPGGVFVQALGTAIASTKVMKAQQVVKGEDGNEVSKRVTHQSHGHDNIPFNYIKK